MAYPRPEPPYGEPTNSEGGRFQLSNDEYMALSAEEKRSVDISRVMRSLDSDELRRFEQNLAEFKNMDLSNRSDRTAMTRFKNFERDRARFNDGVNTRFNGRGFCTPGKIDSFRNDRGYKENLTDREAREISTRFCDAILRSFDNGNGSVFTNTTTSDNYTDAMTTGRPLDAKSSTGQTSRDNLIDYLRTDLFGNDSTRQNNPGGLYSRIKFNQNGIAVFYANVRGDSSGTPDEELDESWNYFMSNNYGTAS